MSNNELNTLILTAHALYDNDNLEKNLEKIGSSLVGSVVAGSKRILIASNSGSRAAGFEYEKLYEYIDDLYLPKNIRIEFLDLGELSKDLYDEFPELKKYKNVYDGITGPFQIGIARDIAVQYFSDKRGYVLVLDDGMTTPYNISKIDLDELFSYVKDYYSNICRNITRPRYGYFIFDIVGATDGAERNHTYYEIYWNKKTQHEILENIDDRENLDKIINYKQRFHNFSRFYDDRCLYYSDLCVEYTPKEESIMMYYSFSGGRHIVPSVGNLVLEFQPPASFNEDFNAFLPNIVINNPIYSANPVRIINSYSDSKIRVWDKIKTSDAYIHGTEKVIEKWYEDYGFIESVQDIHELPYQIEEEARYFYNKRKLSSKTFKKYVAWSEFIRNVHDIAKFVRDYWEYKFLF